VGGRNQALGAVIGWFGWSTFTGVGEHVSVLGYPGNLDRGERLQRNDAEARARDSFAPRSAPTAATGWWAWSPTERGGRATPRSRGSPFSTTSSSRSWTKPAPSARPTASHPGRLCRSTRCRDVGWLTFRWRLPGQAAGGEGLRGRQGDGPAGRTRRRGRRSQACGSTPLSLAVPIRGYMTAARSPPGRSRRTASTS
jgi:hypothetical protein